jgi:hypothetical protein
VIRVNVVFPTTDWESVLDIRTAARAMAGVPGLMEVRVATQEEPAPGATPTGPVAELAFETPDEMRDALAGEAWERLVRSGSGPPVVHAYAVRGAVLGAGGGADHATTDVEVAAEEATEPREAEPLSTQMDLPLSRPPLPEDEAAEGSVGG